MLLHAYICVYVRLCVCVFVVFQELQLFPSSPRALRALPSTRVQTVETPVAPNCANPITHQIPPHTCHFMRRVSRVDGLRQFERIHQPQLTPINLLHTLHKGHCAATRVWSAAWV